MCIIIRSVTHLDQPNPDAATEGYEHLLPRYRRYAPDYDRAWGRYSRATLRKVVELLDRHAPDAKTLLDVGCGTGLLATIVRPRFPDLSLTGVDLSEDMLEKARQRFAADPTVNWHVAQAESLPFEEHAFDVVVSANGFHLVVEYERALREFKRVLKPGGTLVILDWNRAYMTIKFVAMIYPLVDRHPRRIVTRRQLVSDVSSTGLRLIEDQSFRATPCWGMSTIVAQQELA